MNIRRVITLLITSFVVLAALSTPLAGRAQGPAGEKPTAKPVDPLIYEQLAASPDGRADFFVTFHEAADLAPAYKMGWAERGRFVVDALQAVAEASQADVRAWLESHGTTYTSFWINNTLLVHADEATLNALSAFPEVAGFEGNQVYQTMPVRAKDEGDAAPAAELLAPAYPWNVQFPGADQVHADFGIKGQGVVIGGMDTGVDFDHPGLVNNYRGNLGGGSFDHTYSWYDPQGACGSAPCDTDTHGTQTMGIMVGDDDPALPASAWIGMAPDAQWIHCLGCPSGSCSSANTTACAEWFLAPGGDPDLRPQVVNHSWGLWSPNDCNGNSFRAQLTAYRAADILPAFAAGNVGDEVSPPHCWSSTSPANNVDPDGNPLAFASGAHGSTGTLDYYSSGGPSACNNDNLFPDLAAPGLGSCTTQPGGGYDCTFGGTSSASPHTTGCVALVRAANPSLTVAQVEQLLRDAADDVDDGCGSPEESADWNNLYGEGLLDCYEAVLLAGGGDQGALEGTVYDGDTLAPLPGAAVEATLSPTQTWQTVTDGAGFYTTKLSEGAYTVQGAKYGYGPVAVGGVQVTADATTTLDLTLDPAASHVVSGFVTDDGTGAGLWATLDLSGDPVDPPTTTVETDPESGFYSVTLAAEITYTFDVSALLHTPASTVVPPLTGDTTVNVALAATATDGLIAGWVRDYDSGDPLAGATVEVEGVGTFPTDGEGYFQSTPLPPGTYTATASADLHSSLILTDVEVTTSDVTLVTFDLAAPRIEYSPASLSRELTLGSVVTETPGLVITNNGAGALEWAFSEVAGEFTPSAAMGGPDPFGYTYDDSAEFEWLDATGGTALGLSDDGEVNVTLPFPFTFYGTTSTALRVGNNGGLFFDATGGDLPYTNESLATTSQTDLVVPFWDDIDDETGDVYYQTVGTAPNRRFVVEWHDRPHWQYGGGVGQVTFQVILYEGSNNLKFQYQDVVFGDAAWDYGASATVGIREGGSNYLQYAYNEAVLADDLAICFQYPGSPPCDGGLVVPWLQEVPVSGTVGVSATQPITIGWHADVAEVDQPGVYRATLRIGSNDPNAPLVEVPATMTVTAPANWAVLSGTVTSHVPGGPMAGAYVEVISDTSQTVVYSTTTEADGAYGCWLPAGTYTVTVSAAGYLPDEASVTLVAGVPYRHDVELIMDAPSITVSPASISATQQMGEVTTHTVTIDNGGPGELAFSLREMPGGSQTTPVGSGLLGDPPTLWVDDPFRVDAQVRAELEVAPTTDFFIWLRERADLSPAYAIADKDARRRYVFDALTTTAERAQAEIRAYLAARGLRYVPLWINNAILVYGGDQAIIDVMRARGDVVRIRGVYSQMHVPDPEQLAIVTADSPKTAADTLWNIDIVSAPQVWSQLGVTGEGVVVANIDTGVRYTHEALLPSYRGNLGGGVYEHDYNWYPPTADAQSACVGASTAPCDWNGHGSHTMGTLIGGDGDGPFDHDVGMAPDARWTACMGCDQPPNQCSDAALTICAQWMVAPTDLDGNNPDPTQAPDVVNNSWGGGGEDDWYYSYIEAWNAANIIPIFSAGNEGSSCSTLGSPGSYDNVIGVGGTDSQDHNYSLTSRGPGSGTGVFPVQKPDVAAPGELVTSSTNASNASYGAYSGTSMAAPHVAGLVALMRQVEPAIPREEIWDILTTTTDTGQTIKNGSWCGAGPAFPNYVFGYGRINALAAVEETLLRADVPWVGETPISGTVAAGDRVTVTVVFTAPQGAYGVYTATLRVESNDPVTPNLDLPLTMTVPAPPPALTLTKSASDDPVEAGRRLTYTLSVANQGGPVSDVTLRDTLPADTALAWASNGGTLDGNKVVWSGLALPDDGALDVTLAVTVACIPSGTEIVNSSYQVTATEWLTPVVGQPLTVTAVEAGTRADFAFDEPVVRDLPLTFTNLSQGAVAYAWAFGDETTSALANPSHTYAQVGRYTVTLTTTGPCRTDVLSRALVVEDHAAALAPPAAADHGVPGQTVTYTLHLTNAGTLTDTFALSLDGHLWDAALSDETVGPLPASGSAKVEVAITVAPDALDGESDAVTVRATSLGDPRVVPAAASSRLTTTVEVVCLPVGGLSLSWAPAVPRVGRAVVLTGTVTTGTLPLTYTWHFGDGGLGAGPVVSHVYTVAQTYTVTLVVSNACPSQAQVEQAIAVLPFYQSYLPIILRR